MVAIRKKEATGTLAKMLKEYLNSPEGQADYEREKEQMMKLMNIEKSQRERFHKLTVEERNNFINKTILKYRSKEYRDRWYNRGIVPPENLFFFLYDYAAEYGEPIEDETQMFACANYVFDNNWVISLMYGQGTVVIVRTLSDFRYEKMEWKGLNPYVFEDYDKLEKEKKEMEAFVERMVNEYDELVDRVEKLGKFLKTDTFKELDVLEKGDMETQYRAMEIYRLALRNRLKRKGIVKE